MPALKLTAAALAAAFALTACSSTSPPATAPSSAVTSGKVSASSAATSGKVSASSVAASGKVSANTADEGQIAAALKAAGVGNPERWAREVMEYRPYAADDPDLTSLRQNLAKYNPGQETVDKIVSALTP
ncbi:hypothetical protein ACIBG8_51385 [Nonomuraea sp. NPDC050556]|uniref:hypothetical protein n=1 Tax=Nonomuraea sp. NPDC050556 TaxID=3364369 RepID=UPI0037A994D4